MHYQLKSSTFADQLVSCTTSATCFIKNVSRHDIAGFILPRVPAILYRCGQDSPFAFSGHAHLRLVNVVSGASADMQTKPLSLAPGPNVAAWFCADAQPSAPPVPVATAAPKYELIYAQIPVDR